MEIQDNKLQDNYIELNVYNTFNFEDKLRHYIKPQTEFEVLKNDIAILEAIFKEFDIEADFYLDTPQPGSKKIGLRVFVNKIKKYVKDAVIDGIANGMANFSVEQGATAALASIGKNILTDWLEHDEEKLEDNSQQKHNKIAKEPVQKNDNNDVIDKDLMLDMLIDFTQHLYILIKDPNTVYKMYSQDYNGFFICINDFINSYEKSVDNIKLTDKQKKYFGYRMNEFLLQITDKLLECHNKIQKALIIDEEVLSYIAEFKTSRNTLATRTIPREDYQIDDTIENTEIVEFISTMELEKSVNSVSSKEKWKGVLDGITIDFAVLDDGLLDDVHDGLGLKTRNKRTTIYGLFHIYVDKNQKIQIILRSSLSLTNTSEGQKNIFDLLDEDTHTDIIHIENHSDYNELVQDLRKKQSENAKQKILNILINPEFWQNNVKFTTHYVEKQLNRGASPYAVDKFGRTPLHYACEFRYDDVISILALIKTKYVNINKQDNNGVTPLHLAAQHNSVEVLQKLISSGGDKKIKNNRGEKPIDYARRARKFGNVEFLEDRGHNQQVATLGMRS